jgi:N-acetylglucosaminyl-diphospho-decaprenol L-rhamnosyltransferase
MQKLFAVVVTWNGERYVQKCLESLLHSTVPVDVIIVDNASNDKTLEILQEVCPKATLFHLEKNLGFGRANNIGIKFAYEHGAEHVLLINQDAFVAPDVVRGLADLQQAHPEFGILTPLHLEGTGTSLDALFCQHFSKASGMQDLLNTALLDRKSAEIYPAEFINAAIWMLSRECIERVGLFNPAFEHYGEDMEYADRVRSFDLRIGVAAGLHAFHARKQPDPREDLSRAEFLMREKVIIRYRLSRQAHSPTFNFLSALSRIISTRLPGNSSDFNVLILKLGLLFNLITTLPVVARMKRIAYRGGQCFFADAEKDKERFLSGSF